ncbi:MAG: hypothetical protein ACOY3P_20320 [Planctomycetota bacterium]
MSKKVESQAVGSESSEATTTVTTEDVQAVAVHPADNAANDLLPVLAQAKSATLGELRELLARSALDAVLADTSATERQAVFAWAAIVKATDVSSDRQSSADEEFAEVAKRLSCNASHAKQLAKLGWLIAEKECSAIVRRCGSRVARGELAHLVDYREDTATWSIDANHLARLWEHIALDGEKPRDGKRARKLRASCGKAAKSRKRAAGKSSGGESAPPTRDDAALRLGAIFEAVGTDAFVRALCELPLESLESIVCGVAEERGAPTIVGAAATGYAAGILAVFDAEELNPESVEQALADWARMKDMLRATIDEVRGAADHVKGRLIAEANKAEAEAVAA